MDWLIAGGTAAFVLIATMLVGSATLFCILLGIAALAALARLAWRLGVSS